MQIQKQKSTHSKVVAKETKPTFVKVKIVSNAASLMTCGSTNYCNESK